MRLPTGALYLVATLLLPFLFLVIKDMMFEGQLPPPNAVYFVNESSKKYLIPPCEEIRLGLKLPDGYVRTTRQEFIDLLLRRNEPEMWELNESCWDQTVLGPSRWDRLWGARDRWTTGGEWQY